MMPMAVTSSINSVELCCDRLYLKIVSILSKPPMIGFTRKNRRVLSSVVIREVSTNFDGIMLIAVGL